MSNRNDEKKNPRGNDTQPQVINKRKEVWG